MTNTLNKIMHNGTEYDFPEWFTPWNTWTTWQVVTKTANGYEYADAPVTSVNWSTWAVTVSEFSPTSSGSQWQVLTKWASGYDWAAPAASEWIIDNLVKGWGTTIISNGTARSSSWSTGTVTSWKSFWYVIEHSSSNGALTQITGYADMTKTTKKRWGVVWGTNNNHVNLFFTVSGTTLTACVGSSQTDQAGVYIRVTYDS